MKTLLLLLTFLSSSFAYADDCPDGKCLPRLLRKVRLVSEIYRAECLPKKIKTSEIENYHKEHPLTEQCWRYISEINFLDDEITKHQVALDAKTSCETGECKQVVVKPFFQNVEDLLKAVPQNSCTEKKMARVWKRCPDDLKCVLVAGTFGMSGYAAEKYISKDFQPKRCDLGNDACATKFAMAFLDTTAHFFEGVKDLLKMAGRGIANSSKEFWNWVTRVEDHSSTSQLALAKASEDPSIFKELITDFPAAMAKIFEAFFGYIDTWLREEVFCKKWNGLPHVGTCIRPLDSYKCVGCKTLVTGLFCSIPGTAIAELVPAFFSGGMTAAMKHGMKGGAIIARSVKKSIDATKIVKNSRVTTALIDSAAAATSLSVKAYKVSGLRKVTQASIKSIKNLTSSMKTYVAVTPVGKAMVFSKKALASTAKIALLPVDNRMTHYWYKVGARSFDKAFMLGKASNVGEQPLNVSRGLLKLLSPSMHGAHETEKVNEKDKEKKQMKKELKQ